MSVVNLCERCGSLMLGKAVVQISVRENPDVNFEGIEICPGCLSDYYRFLEAKPDRNGTVFKEPYTKPPEQSESTLVLTSGYCGETHTFEGRDFMCLRPKGHKGYHEDGSVEW